MKFLSLLLGLSLLLPFTLRAGERSPIYPFDVKIGGQTAVITGDPETAIFAKIKDPVAVDAELEVAGKAGMLIINIFTVKESGEVDSGVPPKVIFVQSGTKAKLDATMDKSTLTPGLWGANVVFNEGTSRVMFTVK